MHYIMELHTICQKHVEMDGLDSYLVNCGTFASDTS